MSNYVDQLKKQLADVEEKLYAIKKGEHVAGSGGTSETERARLTAMQKELSQKIIDAEASGK
jgi:hypothetical protein